MAEQTKKQPGTNRALNKPVHASSGQETARFACDGHAGTRWVADQYPAYIDIDLRENIEIDTISVVTPPEGYEWYTVYLSKEGRDFTRAGEKTTDAPCAPSGDRYPVGREARYVRVYVTYNSKSHEAALLNVRVTGKLAGGQLASAPTVEVEDFPGSPYDVEPTPQDTVDEVRGILARNVGDAYQDWFEFSLAPNKAHDKYDYFTLEDSAKKVRITGNSGVSLAVGLNHYLKYFCNVHIAQVGSQTVMPKAPVPVGAPVRRETAMPVRYAYNYCTHSYTMAFWGEAEWRQELDWLALNGVNVVLDLTGQEEVWRRFLCASGYSHQEAKDFITGPAYYAWMYMANVSGFGGPVHDDWFARRTKLARSNHLAMRRLGMHPVLQAYNGMVPPDIAQKDPRAKIIPQGKWNAFERPAVLKTTSYPYIDYANRFYACQRAVYGDITPYFATDPFHEGGRHGLMPMSSVSKRIMQTLLENRPDAVWILQSWGTNPTIGLLKGLSDYREHTLILDLYAEKAPRWEKWAGGEFADSPWVYCMLNNFGGRMGIHGHIEAFVREVPRAAHVANHMRGIGITPEACRSNPILPDLFFETVWSETPDDLKPIDTDAWIAQYARRRYGAESQNAVRALTIFRDTAYNPACNGRGEGAPESVVNARPAQNVKSASTWSHSRIGYDKTSFEDAVALLFADWNRLKASAGYQYDAADTLKQLLANSLGEYQKAMSTAYQLQQEEEFAHLAARFLACIDLTEQVLGTQTEFLVGSWIAKARALASGADDFTCDLYEQNARALITTWGAIRQANDGQLKDYSNRQWAGLTRDFYKPRWERWIAQSQRELDGAPHEEIDWFPMEWRWVLNRKAYETQPNGLDLSALARRALTAYRHDMR